MFVRTLPSVGRGTQSAFNIDPSTRLGLTEDLLSRGMSSAVWLGETLDKVDRPFRQLIAEGLSWFTGHDHDFKPSELLAWVPFSDTMGLTDPANIATGHDLTGYDDPDSMWDGVLNFGAEVLASPTTYLTGGLAAGAKGATTAGGKALKKLGLLDEALELSARSSGRMLDQAGGLSPRLTKQRTTLREAVDLLKDRVRRDVGYNTKDGKQAADLLEAGVRKRLGPQAASDDVFENLLDQNLGGLWELQGPFGLGGMSKNINAPEWLTSAVDKTWNKVAYSPGIRHLRGIFNKKMHGAVTRVGQHVARKGSLALEDARIESLTRLAKAQHAFDATGEFDVASVVKNHSLTDDEAVQRVLENQKAVRGYLEGTGSLPTHLESLETELTDMSGILSTLITEAKRRDLDIDRLTDLYVNYFPRKFNDIDEIVPQGLGTPLLKTRFSSQLSRHKDIVDLPGGTVMLMDLASDPAISGLAVRRGLKSRLGKKRIPLTPEEQIEELAHRGVEQIQLGERGFKAPAGAKVVDEIINIIKTDPKYANFIEQLKNGVDEMHPNYSRMHNVQIGVQTGPDTYGLEWVPKGAALSDDELDDALRGVANWLKDLDPRYADEGIPVFKVDVLEDFSRYVNHIERAIKGADTIHDMFVHMAVPVSQLAADGIQHIRLRDALSEIPGLRDTNVAHSRLAQRFQAPENITSRNQATAASLSVDLPLLNSGDLASRMNEMAIPQEIFDDARRVMESFTPTKNPAVRAWAEALMKFQDAWKAGVTKLWPKFWSRNLVGGQANNFFKDAHDPRYNALNPMRWLAPLSDANAIMGGKALKGLQDVPGFESLTDAEATQKLMDMVYANGVFSSRELGVAHTLGDFETMGEMMKVLPENEQRGFAGNILRRFTDAGREVKDMGAASLLTPKGMAEQLTPYGLLRGRGAFGPKGTTPLGDVSYAAALGGEMSNLVEGFNRLSPFIAYIRQGFDPTVAARKVFAAQVDYKNLSNVERKYFRTLFPFYSFTRGMVPFVIEDVLTKRGGKQAWTIRGIGRTQREDPTMEGAPEFIRRSTGLSVDNPFLKMILGDPQKQGHTRFIRGVGLPFEDVVSLIGAGEQTFTGSLMDSARAVAGRLSPMAKAIPEWATGESFFHQRPLRELESRYAKLFTDKDVGAMPFMDMVLDMTPGVSRMAQLVGRTMDDRKRFEWADTLFGEGRASGVASGLAGELLPFALSDYNTELSRKYNIMDAAKKRLHGQPYISMFGDRPYVDPAISRSRSKDPEVKARHLRMKHPELYDLLSLYSTLSREVRK